jgi:signal transduction histidine kinase
LSAPELEILLEKARHAEELHARRAHEAAIRADVASAVARGASLVDMLTRCTDALVNHLGAAFARVWTLDETGQTLLLRASSGIYTHIDGGHARVPVGAFKIGRIAATGEPHCTNDVLRDPRVDTAWATREGLLAFAGYPLDLDGRRLGVIALFSRQALPEETLTLLSSVSELVAVGIDRKLAEAERERLIADLARTNAELDQFAYVASHDLKAPLRGIGNLTQWIEEDLGGAAPPEVREHMALLRGRVARLEALIDAILDYSRAGRVRGKEEVIDTQLLAQEVIDLVAPRPPARVILVSELPRLEGERVKLQQVLLNLIGNALKHARREDATVSIGAVDRGACWEIFVSDDGPGIPPEYRERVWGLFQTLEARDAVEGAGIGLSVVRKIVETRGGHAWVDEAPAHAASERGPAHGTTIRFTWPKASATTSAAATPRAAPRALQPAG